MKVGDRVRLPPTLSQPGGEYRIVAIDDDRFRLVSTKERVKRAVAKDQLPALVARATPAPTTALDADAFARDEGVLSRSGYHVGAAAAMPAINRQIVLRRVFTMPAAQLPSGNDEAYRAEWGEERSQKRLYKMACCLESFISAHLTRGLEYKRSIAEWKEDLAWLGVELGAPINAWFLTAS
jgi:hypothetical protein